MKTLVFIIIVGVGLSMFSPLMALTQFNDGETHNISTTINDDLWVDYLSPDMKTTVDLFENGSILSPFVLTSYSQSKIRISDGIVTKLVAYDNSEVIMSKGSVSQLFAWDNSQIVMSGGEMRDLFAFSKNQVTLSGGTIGVRLLAAGGQVTISGGSVSQLLTFANSHVSISGGLITDRLHAVENSQITIYGSSFTIDGDPIGYNQITSLLGGDILYEPYRILTGTMTNGDIVNYQFKIGNSASINLVPVPESSSLVGFGTLLISLISFRRWRK